MSDNNGVYIGKDIEVVITQKYTLAYRKNSILNRMESYLLYTDGFRCIGACFTALPTNDCGFDDFKYYGERTESIRYTLGIQADDTFFSDKEMSEYLGKRLFSITKTNNDEYFVLFSDDVSYLLLQHESFDNGLTCTFDDANNENVDKCLQQWHLGAKEIKLHFNNNEYIIGIEINTPKHMYVFRITTDFIYCRAARYTTCKKGVVFDQNFRQNFHVKNQKLSGEIAMYDDNTVAAKELDFDKNLFGSACVFNGVSIYWSVGKIDSDVITLNGCGGDIYKWRKPKV